MKKLAIFDFDGTIFNSITDVIICFNKALSVNGFPTLTYEEYIEILGGNIDELVSLSLKDKNTPENMELVKNTYDEIYGTSNRENSLPFDGMHEVLLELQKKGILLAINSNRKNDSIKKFIGKYYSDIDFKAIEGHNPAYPSKPRPCGVKKMLHKLKVSKDDAIYIGDSSTDIKTAKNAEIDCVIVKWGYGDPEDYVDEYILDAIEKPSDIFNFF
ncbi:HAD family hydrolase [uncultured Methanobrevibacter sp.]|uniref:HAD family hydrolase n=1 Tax=uncultured Methanobrevibacter sp. TaxID=253161 RepID=UPI0025DD8A48|nr:HAD family hydrolase [uncultured Methanobrevibacter sp.]MCI6994586.1 HAD family hydrolase [Methanobrevibacter sp.]